MAHLSEREFQERWAFLRPWCASIRGYLLPHCQPVELGGHPREYVISVHMPTTRLDALPDKMQAIRDVLVLLTLLWHVDGLVWSRVLSEYCGLPRLDPADVFDCHRVRFRLQLTVMERTCTWEDVMLANFFSDLDSRPTSQFVEAVGQIVADQAPSWTSLDGRLEVHIDVDVELFNVDRYGTSAACFEKI